jgi:NADH-quinone oxidoreductase subunit L
MDQASQALAGSQLLVWIPLLPLLGAAFNLLLGRWMPKWVIHTVAVAAVGASFVISAILVFRGLLPSFGEGHEPQSFHQLLYTWIEVGSFKAQLAFRLDTLSAVMILIVTFVGTLIHIYSTGYMAHDPR